MPRRRAPKKKANPSRLPVAPPAPKAAKEPPPNTLKEDKRYTPWLESLEDREYSSAEDRLHDEILACVSYLSETPEEKALVAHVRKTVSATLRRSLTRWRCEILVFGSTDTGLRLPGSDIDLAIKAPDSLHKKNTLRDLSWTLRENEWCRSVNMILGARVPIISFLTTDDFGSLKFDVGINNLEGSITGQFVKQQLQKMPALRPLVFVIKSALAQRDLNDASKSGISSFAVICMCVFYLQLNPHRLPEEHLSKPMDNRSLGAILCGFLKYYSREVPYKKMYISVYDCCLVPKDTMAWINDDWVDSLVVECPCTPGRNITGALTFRMFERIRGIFAHVQQVIGEATGSSRNILQLLVSVDAKFIQYREHVRRLVESGQIPSNGIRSASSPAESNFIRGPSSKVDYQRQLTSTSSSASKNARRW